MAIYRLFKDKAFEPEAISTMTRTYTEVCQTLGLSDGDLAEGSGDTKTMAAEAEIAKTTVSKTQMSETRVSKTEVAKTVIEYAQRGAQDHTRLRDCVLQALGQ